MNEEVLTEVLKEILEEQKKQTIEIQFLTKVIEVSNEDIKQLHTDMSAIDSEDYDKYTKHIANIMINGIHQVKEIVASQPKNVLHEKRILFFPEGQGKDFLKTMIRNLLITFCILGIAWIIVRTAAPYYIENSENAIYKDTFQWIYVNTSDKVQNVMLKELQDMRNDSIRKIRLDEINSTLK